MSIHKHVATTAAVICLMTFAGLSGAAEPVVGAPPVAPRAEHCLSLIRISDSKILDSRHILFTMNDKRMYLNTLPNGCPGMRRDDAYMFRTSLNQLCDLDIITILNPAGFGFLPGPSCGLGMFEPVTQEQVDALKLKIEAGKK